MRIDKHNFQKLLIDFNNLPKEDYRPTYMQICGYPHYENVASNILKFFLDPQNPHGMNDILLQSILKVVDLNAHADIPPFESADVQTEVTTSKGRIDILVVTDSHCIVIENKIYHTADSNPFEDYANYTANHYKDKEQVLITLGLKLHNEGEESGFTAITYTQLFNELKARLPAFKGNADTEYDNLLEHFIKSIENLTKGTNMNPENIKFIEENQTSLIKLQSELNIFKKDLRSKLEALKDKLAEFKHDNNMQFGYFSKWSKLQDVLFCNIQVSDQRTIAIDITLGLDGWHLGVFERQNRAENTPKFHESVHLGTLGKSVDKQPIIEVIKIDGYTNTDAEELLVQSFQKVLLQLQEHHII